MAFFRNLKSAGDCFRAVALASARGQLRHVDHEAHDSACEVVNKTLTHGVVEKTALAENSGVTGGYLVPPELELDIKDLLEQYSPFFSRGYVQPMKHEQIFVPGADITATNASGSPVLYGGFNPSVKPEATTLPESEPSFVGPNLVARNVEAYALASFQLVMDGGEPLGAYLMRLFYLALLWKSSFYFCQGNGSDQPMGLVGSPASVLVTRQTPSKVTVQDTSNMIGSIIPACLDRAVWLVNPSALKQVVQISGFVPNQWNYKEPGACGFLYTRPVYVTDQLPAVGVKGDVVLYDPMQYAVGWRSLEIAASDVPRFFNGQVVYRSILRVDGQPLAKSTVTLADGVTTAGISVVLV